MAKLKNVRITVLQNLFLEELALEYGPPGLTACSRYKPGEIYISERGFMPPGFCDEAWKSFSHIAFSLARGMEVFFPDWSNEQVIASCNDGVRPVIFKLEAVEAEEKGN